MLNIESVNQYYGGSHILRNVSLQIEKGQVLALLGRNGVGKTALLKCVMGLLRIQSGSVSLNGQRIDGLRPDARARLGLGYVPQGREVFPRLTVEENLRMGLAAGPKSRTIPEHLFELFPGLEQMLRRRGGDLSGGQQQQLAIARALAAGPQLLMLDEPTEGIQPSIVKDIERVIRRLAARGDMAILLVEQYYDFARSLADRYAVMSRGQIIRAGQGTEMEAGGVRELLTV